MPPEGRMSKKLLGLTDEIRRMVLEAKPGRLIGQEPELCEKLRCTRAMLRQACRLLEFQGLLVVKRGARGGYFGARPSAESVVATAAIYLEAREISLEEALRATNTFTIAAMKLACECPLNHPGRQHLQDLRCELSQKYPEDMDAIEFASDEGRIDEVIFELVNNDPLELLIKILNRVSINEFGERVFVRQPQRRVHFRQLRFTMIDAILARDTNAAEAAMRELHNCVLDWLPLDPESRTALAAVA